MNSPPIVRAPIADLDPGWLFLLAGIGIIAATVLIPALDELSAARVQRDRAIALYENRADRNTRYQTYLTALGEEQPSLVAALAATQLNQIPVDRQLVLEPPDPATASASVFPALEPPPPTLPEWAPSNSVLHRLATGQHSRTWLIAAGGLCLLLGVLPAEHSERKPQNSQDEAALGT
ncbi:MAG: hypothetical protein IT437_05045 [Phycisphaerales bacterium]|nr:hypothetical protein [Phycisphaerales bacterium]